MPNIRFVRYFPETVAFPLFLAIFPSFKKGYFLSDRISNFKLAGFALILGTFMPKCQSQTMRKRQKGQPFIGLLNQGKFGIIYILRLHREKAYIGRGS